MESCCQLCERNVSRWTRSFNVWKPTDHRHCESRDQAPETDECGACAQHGARPGSAVERAHGRQRPGQELPPGHRLVGIDAQVARGGQPSAPCRTGGQAAWRRRRNDSDRPCYGKRPCALCGFLRSQGTGLDWRCGAPIQPWPRSVRHGGRKLRHLGSSPKLLADEGERGSAGAASLPTSSILERCGTGCGTRAGACSATASWQTGLRGRTRTDWPSTGSARCSRLCLPRQESESFPVS